MSGARKGGRDQYFSFFCMKPIYCSKQFLDFVLIFYVKKNLKSFFFALYFTFLSSYEKNWVFTGQTLREFQLFGSFFDFQRYVLFFQGGNKRVPNIFSIAFFCFSGAKFFIFLTYMLNFYGWKWKQMFMSKKSFSRSFFCNFSIFFNGHLTLLHPKKRRFCSGLS